MRFVKTQRWDQLASAFKIQPANKELALLLHFRALEVARWIESRKFRIFQPCPRQRLYASNASVAVFHLVRLFSGPLSFAKRVPNKRSTARSIALSSSRSFGMRYPCLTNASIFASSILIWARHGIILADDAIRPRSVAGARLVIAVVLLTVSSFPPQRSSPRRLTAAIDTSFAPAIFLVLGRRAQP